METVTAVVVVAVVVVVSVVVEIAHSQIQRLRAVETMVVNLVEEVEAEVEVVEEVVEIAHSQIQRLRAVETMVVNLVEEVEAEVEVVEEVVEVLLESDLMLIVHSKLRHLRVLEAEVEAETVAGYHSRPELHLVVLLVVVEMMVRVNTVGCPVLELLQALVVGQVLLEHIGLDVSSCLSCTCCDQCGASDNLSS